MEYITLKWLTKAICLSVDINISITLAKVNTYNFSFFLQLLYINTYVYYYKPLES
jgi:hypothetical protein